MGSTAITEIDCDPRAKEDAALDLVFGIRGTTLPACHRHTLRQAIASALPWFEDDSVAAIHPLKSAHAAGGAVLMSARSRLVLRVPAGRAAAAAKLCGQVLVLGTDTLTVGSMTSRPLLGHGTVYAHLVTTDFEDEHDFTVTMRDMLQERGLHGEIICGLRQTIGAGKERLQGYSVMVHGLARDASLSLQSQGTGRDMKLGCGIFVPHRSAAPVGS